jgi:hypothetical protein
MAFDETATASGGIDIPAMTGVNYLIDAVAASAGPNLLTPGDYVVTAEPQFGYALGGVTSWDLTINAYVPPIIEVTPLAPSATHQTATAPGFITIPLSTGVDYALDDIAVAAGNHNVAPGPHTVVAAAQAGYALLGQTSWNLTVNAYVPPQIQFVGSTGREYSGALTLPAGWQPGDLAVVFVTMNTATQPPVPGGYTSLAAGNTTGTSSPHAGYRLSYRVLQAGDAGPNLVGSYRSASMMVYRNARIGNAAGYATKLTVSPYNMTILGLTPSPGLQQPGVSWVGTFLYIDNTAVRERALAGFTNRTAGTGFPVGTAPSNVAGYDSNAAVSSFANITGVPGTYAGAASASFELRYFAA